MFIIQSQIISFPSCNVYIVAVKKWVCYLFVLLLMVSFEICAEPTESVYVSPMAVSTDGMLQMIGSLLLVLAIIGVIAWLMKRYALSPGASANGIKIIATSGVGQRERVVIIEVEETWLVLGVAPGQVNTLHRIDKPSGKQNSGAEADKFSEKLTHSIEKL